MKKFYRKQKKEIERQKKLKKLKHKYNQFAVQALGNRNSTAPTFYQHLADQRSMADQQKPYPRFSPILMHLATQKNVFSDVKESDTDSDIVLPVPKIFSLIEYGPESFNFIKLLFLALYSRKAVKIQIDYQHCTRIEPDASAVLDVLLREFIQNIHMCRSLRLSTTRSIEPINFQRPEIEKILFSIGSYSVLRKLSIKFPGIESFPLRTGTFTEPKKRELDNTELVDYIITCLSKCNRILTGDAERELSDIIGEVMANAEEHSSTKRRFVIGYFTFSPEDPNTLGTFHLVIFNFGDTIYQKFKDPNCPNQGVVKQMTELSRQYLSKGWFRSLIDEPSFEEETLWTLYSLQQGVTRFKDWHRGSGTMEFIESFFSLKGDDLPDEDSRLTLFSGNTRIIFDGSYKPNTVFRPDELNGAEIPIKIMTFNRSCKIDKRPDRKFVNFADNFFPGTMIVAKIRIKSSNTEPN